LCRAAGRQVPRTGPGAPLTYADWQIAVLIMVAVLAQRKSKSAQYRYLSQRRVWLKSRLSLRDFPSRSTYFIRYGNAHRLFERAIRLQGRQAIAQGLVDPQVVAVDKSLIPARGPVWSPQARRRGRRPRGLDDQAGWGYSEHHGWVYGYSYEAVVTAKNGTLVFPLLGSAGPANLSEHRSLGSKIPYLPAGTRYVLADAGYDSNAYTDAVEYLPNGRTTGRHFLCPPHPRGGKPAVGRLAHRGRRERNRQRRIQRQRLLNSPQGRRLYQRRRVTVEPFNEWFKDKFGLHQHAWHRGLENNATAILAALFCYQLLVRYNHKQGHKNGCIQWILDTI
jgi:hypothetical protein